VNKATIKDGMIIIGKSSFLIDKLKDVTLEEALEHYKRLNNDDRVRNAWKRANGKK